MEIDPKYQVSWSEELIANVRGLGLVAKATPLYASLMLAITFISAVAPAVIIAQTGAFIQNIGPAVERGMESQPGMSAVRALVWLAGAIVLTQVIGPVRSAVHFAVQRRFHAYLSRRMMVGISELPGLAYFEDPEFRDKLEVTSWIGWAPVQSVEQFAQGIQNIIQLGAMFVLAGRFAGWVPVLITVASIPSGIAAWYYTSVVGLVQWRYSPEIRRAGYFKDLALLKEAAKELRISLLRDWSIGRMQKHWLSGKEEVWKKQHRSLVATLLLQVVAVGAMTFAYLAILRATIAGRTDIATFTVSTMGLTGVMTALIGVFQSAAGIRRNNYWLPVALRLMSLAKTEPRLDVTGTRSAHGLAPTGIRFENVSFAYRGSNRTILDGLNLDIAPGSSIALVGENGAGKTTLIKLLCRFYDPTEGRILLDGVDIREFDLVDLRTRLAVIFQDFVKYNFSAKDNVGFGAVEQADDMEMLKESASRVGVLEKIEALPDGWQTPLAREFGGVDLSGGEWQRVALARAMAAQLGRGSDILILDEPTASLDVRLEHELYERFNELSRGQTTLLVSHRFSTVRMAQRIVFMENGRIVEDGSHEELMSKRGRYWSLYEIQASHYREEGELP